jgi:hypothetical protein
VNASGHALGHTEELIQQLEDLYTRFEQEPLTIGWFYGRIARAIVEIEQSGAQVFVGDDARQLTPAAWPGSPGRLYRITDRASALLAIHEIVRQGEGASFDDPRDNRHELAHYYRFQEIVKGREMVRNPGGDWVFEGRPIPFDPAGVFPMVDDPDTAALDPHSPAGIASLQFDQTYTSLLRSIHEAVNGKPARLSDAVGLMFSLRLEAQKLMTIPIDPGPSTVAGPSFQRA